MKTLNAGDILKEGIGIGLKNIPSVIGAVILWVLTIWIPYINVGTTVALASLPVELSKGKIMSPTSIFDAKYRENMGEFFLLMGFMMMGIYAAMAFMFVPGIIVGLAWMMAIPLFIDKKLPPLQAIRRSSELMDGNKMPVFLGLMLLPTAGFMILAYLFMQIGTIGLLLILIVYIAYFGLMIGGQAYIYRELALNADDTSSSKANDDILDA